MSEREQTDAFAGDLAALIERYCAEFDLSNAAAIGVLEIQKHQLIAAALEDGADDDDGERT